MGRYNNDSGLFSMAEFKNRGVIKMAPDALVFISGNFGTSVVAPVSGKTQKIDFQDGISTINVQNTIDPPGSSTASIEVITPIYDDKSNYWITFKGPDGRQYKYPYFTAMMEVKIFFKGRFLVGGEPKYYPAFWGFITGVEESFSGGTYKMTLQCADMLHWWTYVQVAYKPGVASNIFTGYKQGLTAYASRFKEANAFQILYTLVTEMGYENFTPPDWLGKATPKGSIFPALAVEKIYGGILEYWKKRWANQANSLKMYGASGNLIYDPRVPTAQQSTSNVPNNPKDTEVNKTKQAAQSRVKFDFGVDDNFTKAFQVFHIFDKMGDIENAEYLTKLEIASQVKTAVEYEFFQDVNGNFIFKPPFYNLNTKNLMAYRIKPQEIINFSSNVNSDEIVTALQVQTSIQQNIRAEDFVNYVGYHIDMDLTKKFGERLKKISLWYMTDGRLARSLAAGHLSLMNVKAYSGSVTIPGRPELRLGYPVYIEHKDVFYYPRAINHAFDYGGSFTTSLSLEGVRNRIYGQETGRWEVLTNRIYKLTDKFIQKPDQTTDVNKTTQQINEGQVADPDKKLEEHYRSLGIIQSLEPGRYEIVKSDMVQMGPNQVDRRMIQNDSIPYTDEEGYQVIGSFKYGRGIVLKAGTIMDGFTVAQTSTTNSSDKAVIAERNADSITNMNPASDMESAVMSNYFQVTKTSGVENSIPDYLDLLAETQTQSAQSTAEQVSSMSIKGNTGSVSNTPTLNSQNFVEIRTNQKVKTPGSGDAPIYNGSDTFLQSFKLTVPGTTFVLKE